MPKAKQKTPKKPTRIVSLVKGAISSWLNHDSGQLCWERMSIKLHYKKNFLEWWQFPLFLYVPWAGLPHGRNCLVRCSDSASKYRCGRCEPSLTSNYPKWTKWTGKSLSQQIKINKVRVVTSSTLRTVSQLFILPVFCSGPWTQRPGHCPVGRDTPSKAQEPWG